MGELVSLNGAVFWVFQIFNCLTALSMFLAPCRFHESMLKNPDDAYAKLGFSDTAVEMLHNVLRGQGAALLAISCALFYMGAGSRASFLSIGLTCGFSALAHVATMRHHLRSANVMDALGNINAIYPILGLNLALALMALWVFCFE